jgi:hypothetical protein
MTGLNLLGISGRRPRQPFRALHAQRAGEFRGGRRRGFYKHASRKNPRRSRPALAHPTERLATEAAQLLL